ncbi:hypothetical protein ACUXAV_002206 [Cupriavidus metallidurans]|jgi:hypothetical protein|uniref:PepSY domain-containing protein n=1 Tax=Cupriavidus metallidurans (strain ATCC 43123 / DSM 2839 / NBRC 102507 / CH34) TaxID=266264 RepID=Q1LC76_CUPMC|nr:PepSY domain-containing protein [Cupriavidus metallidurans]ABF12250.1 conserved hypothetical protein (secreted) [Cupriavidus metallidurans CH34]AVA35637.1 PepSY domain-containing protein [Cupriavidus metallidurans]KWW35464.1 hypothetical protein AU374_03531 [Cupriavidus metallidurans]MDE4921605.1 PepSY domain-containing protein [Cupriavidus metallidurans]QGS32501.1 PepSY domain-containing protein [Cupriavidus metallidurans]
MKRLRIGMGKTLVLAMLALGGATVGIHTVQAHDRDDCEAPINDWKPRDAVRAMAQQKGWQVDKLKIDDGCYEIKGRDKDGQRFKAKIDPVTLDVVRMKREGDHGDRGAGRTPANAVVNTAPANAVTDSSSTPATKPQVEIR